MNLLRSSDKCEVVLYYIMCNNTVTKSASLRNKLPVSLWKSDVGWGCFIDINSPKPLRSSFNIFLLVGTYIIILLDYVLKNCASMSWWLKRWVSKGKVKDSLGYLSISNNRPKPIIRTLPFSWSHSLISVPISQSLKMLSWTLRIWYYPNYPKTLRILFLTYFLFNKLTTWAI